MALTDINDAARDGNLLNRLTAAAAAHGVSNPQRWVEENRYRLVTHKVSEDGQTIADVYAYAVATTPPPPGANTSAVTDPYLMDAVEALVTEPEPEPTE